MYYQWQISVKWNRFSSIYTRTLYTCELVDANWITKELIRLPKFKAPTTQEGGFNWDQHHAMQVIRQINDNIKLDSRIEWWAGLRHQLDNYCL